MNHFALITNVNQLMERARNVLHQEMTYELGPDYISCDPSLVHQDLIRFRFCKKFSRPSSSNDSLRREKSIDGWLSLEEKLSNFTYSPTWEQRWTCMRASSWLHKHLRHCSFGDVTAPIEFTPGESYVSCKGLTSVRQKLNNLKHWTVTWEAADLAADLVWSHNALRTCALKHLSIVIPDHPINTTCSANYADYKASFIQLVKDHLFRYVNGARMALVPKDNEKDRVINVEPTFNMLLQRQLGLILRSLLKKLGNDLGIGQSDHRRLISLVSKATIDFSNASDSHILAMFEMMFPKDLVEYIRKIRSSMTWIKDRDLEVYNFKLSSMGNGFTFEIMTLLLLSLARVNDAEARVYGDDVIVSNDSAPLFIEAAESLGWVINRKKTFINSPFRESCGAFYHDTLGYLVCYDFHWCKNLVDVITTVNKLRILTEIVDIPTLTQLYKDIHRVIPASLKGPLLNKVDEMGYPIINDSFVETSNWIKSHGNNKDCRRRFQTLPRAVTAVSRNLNDSIIGVIDTYRIKSRVIRDLRRNVLDTYDTYAVLYGLLYDTQRGFDSVTKHVKYVTRSGNILSRADIRRLAATP